MYMYFNLSNIFYNTLFLQLRLSVISLIKKKNIQNKTNKLKTDKCRNKTGDKKTVILLLKENYIIVKIL